MEYTVLHRSRVIQILPAEGYSAYYFDSEWEEGGENKFAFSRQPVICWALVEYDDKSREITGMAMENGASTMDFPATLCTFMGFAPTNEPDGPWHQSALVAQKRYLEELKFEGLRSKVSLLFNNEDVQVWSRKDCKLCFGKGRLKPDNGKKICYCILREDLSYNGKNQEHKAVIMKVVESVQAAKV